MTPSRTTLSFLNRGWWDAFAVKSLASLILLPSSTPSRRQLSLHRGWRGTFAVKSPLPLTLFSDSIAFDTCRFIVDGGAFSPSKACAVNFFSILHPGRPLSFSKPWVEIDFGVEPAHQEPSHTRAFRRPSWTTKRMLSLRWFCSFPCRVPSSFRCLLSLSAFWHRDMDTVDTPSSLHASD